MLNEAIKSYAEFKTFDRHTPAYFKDKYEFLREVDSLALCNAQLNLNKAFKNRFSKKSKKQSGFPKFKSKKYKQSYKTHFGLLALKYVVIAELKMDRNLSQLENGFVRFVVL